MKKKPLLIFLHGLGGNSRSFQLLIEQLKECESMFEFVALDFLGFGGRPVPKSIKHISMKALAEQVMQEISERDHNRARAVHLIGHSMGGAVAVEVHRIFPELMIDSFVNLEGNLQREDCTTSKKVGEHSRDEFCTSQFVAFKREVRVLAQDGDITAKYWAELVPENRTGR